ncbi:uncharacterized protein LOC100572589 [Acyrthosiphon pisum]|uniref:C2H2-type domain-containing protein n=1 Tax=Acyrthosiphon pisum TaxID=7029 RepID=A0A8R1W7C0_ACYPI|nr:uncharacterized protein LOC100572589 [Acyrthosiphon pisum]XP_016657537.1 uncharacterized protein LOC100572589 [Acyrthosiphon pisum]|eukprot:XP_003242481.1 PREDICTED: uncharacterized protein LOC100572589 [Acyrthosiphon pisum]
MLNKTTRTRSAYNTYWSASKSFCYCNYCCYSYSGPNSIKIVKKKQQQQQQQQQPQPQTQRESANKMKIYRCGSCTFKSIELGHNRFHMRSHTNKKKPEKPILKHPGTKALTLVLQQKIRIHRCEVCSNIFDSRNNCIEHAEKQYNQSTAPIKKLQIVLRRIFMKTMQMWKKNGRLGHFSRNP